MKEKAPIFILIGLLFVIIFVFGLILVTVDPTQATLAPLEFEGEIALVQLNPTSKVSVVVFLIIIAFVFMGFAALLYFVFNINGKANRIRLQSIIDTHPALNDKGIDFFIKEEKTFILACKDYDDEKIDLKELRMLVELIENEATYPLYIKTMRLPALKHEVLYSVYIRGELIVDQGGINDLTPHLVEILAAKQIEDLKMEEERDVK